MSAFACMWFFSLLVAFAPCLQPSERHYERLAMAARKARMSVGDSGLPPTFSTRWEQGPVKLTVHACDCAACDLVFVELLDSTLASRQGWQERRDLSVSARGIAASDSKPT